MGQKSEMKLDIHLRSFTKPCGVYEVSRVNFLSAGKAWKRSKNGTITLSVSARKCDETLDLCIDHTEFNHMTHHNDSWSRFQKTTSLNYGIAARELVRVLKFDLFRFPLDHFLNK